MNHSRRAPQLGIFGLRIQTPFTFFHMLLYSFSLYTFLFPSHFPFVEYKLLSQSLKSFKLLQLLCFLLSERKHVWIHIFLVLHPSFLESSNNGGI